MVLTVLPDVSEHLIIELNCTSLVETGRKELDDLIPDSFPDVRMLGGNILESPTVEFVHETG